MKSKSHEFLTVPIDSNQPGAIICIIQMVSGEKGPISIQQMVFDFGAFRSHSATVLCV